MKMINIGNNLNTIVMENNYIKEDKYLRAKKKVENIKGFYHHLFWYLVVNMFLSFGALWNSRWDEISFWSFATWIFWGIGLLFHGLTAFGINPLFTKAWEERKIREIMDKDNL